MNRTAEDFIQFLKPHYNSAARYCRALFRQAKDAEDGLQDAMITALKGFATLKDESRFRSWFFTIITRTYYASLKKEKRKAQLFTVLKETEGSFPDVYETDFFAGKASVLMEALDTLNEKERAAILLFELGGFSISEIMDIQEEQSLSAVKSRLSRTREKLRNTILSLEQQKQQGDTYDIQTNASGF